MTITQKLNENFLTVFEFVDYVGSISSSGVYKKIQKGTIPSIVIDNKIYIPRKWVKENYDDAIEAALAKVVENG